MRLTFKQIAEAIGDTEKWAKKHPDEAIEKFKAEIHWRPHMGDIVISDRKDIQASVATMAKGVASAVASSAGRLVRGEPVLVPKEVAASRQAFCDSCEHYRPDSGRCSLCGCSMSAKTTLASSRCPVNKWGRYTEVDKAAKDADAPA